MRVCIFISIFLIFVFVSPSFAETYIGGTISSNTTLTLAGSPYIITTDIEIGKYRDSCTLTIEPGVELRFEPGTQIRVGWNSAGYVCRGRLIADGTPENRIIFTSNSSDPQPGDWNGIYFTSYSYYTLPDQISHCDIMYAGGGNYGIYVYSNGNSIHRIFDDCVVEYSLGQGFLINENSVTIQNCKINNNVGYGVYGAASHSIINSQITNNVGGGVYFSSGGSIGTTEEYTCDLYDNGEYNVVNVGSGTINAQFNYWGTDISSEIEAKLFGNVDYSNYVSEQNFIPLVVSILDPVQNFEVDMNESVLLRVALTDENEQAVVGSSTNYCKIKFSTGESDVYLLDNGQNDDLIADDGIFTATWYPLLKGDITLTAQAYAPDYGDGSSSVSGTVHWAGSSNCLPINEILSICADNIVEGPLDVYTCSGNISIGNILQFNGSVVVDKQVFLVNPELRGSGSIIVKDIQGADHVIYNNPTPYTFYVHDDSLFNYDALIPLQFNLFGFNLAGGHIGVDPDGPTVKVDYVISFPSPLDDWMSKISKASGAPATYFQQVSFGNTYDRSGGVFSEGDIGPFAIDYIIFKLSNLSIYWDEFEQKIGGSGKVTWKNPKDPINNYKSNYSSPFDDDLSVEIRDESGTVLKKGTLSELSSEIEALSSFFPSGIGFELEFLAGKLNKIILVVEGSLYLGATGLRITQFTAGIEDLQTDPTIVGSIDIATLLPSVPVFGDPIKIDDFGVRWKRTKFRGEGALEIFGYELASAYLEADALAVSLSGGGELGFGTYMYGKADFTMAIDHANGSAKMTIQIPENVPIWLRPLRNKKIASASISMTNFNDWQAQVTLLGISAAVRRYFDTNAPYDHFKIGRNLNSLNKSWKGFARNAQVIEYTVPVGIPQLVVAATNDINVFDFNMTSPSEIVYDSTNSNYDKYDSALVTIMVIDNPESGTWQFATEQGGDIQVEVLAADQVPTATFTEPSVVGGMSSDISLDVSDMSDTIHVSLYYDTDRSDFNGVPITSFDAINSSSVLMTWNTYNIPDGEYFIYCRVDDGENAPIMTYAPGSILLSSPNTVEQPQNILALQSDDSVEVTWDLPADPSVIITNITVKDQGDLSLWTYSTIDSGLFYITDLAFGHRYDIWLQFEDSAGYFGPKSEIVNISLIDDEANNPPYFSFDQDSIWYCTVGQPGSTPVTATDLDDNSLTYSVTSSPVGLTVASDSLYWSPTEDQSGYYTFEVVVDDGQGGSDTTTIGAAVLNTEQVEIDVFFSGTSLYNYDNHFVSVSHFGLPDTLLEVTVINQRSEEQANVSCNRASDFTFTGGFKLNSIGTGLFAVEHGDTILAEYSFDNTTYSSFAVFDSTGQPSDVTPPNTVTDLGYTLFDYDSLTLFWTTPGDDSSEGQAMYYDLRYNYTGITVENDYVNAYKYTELGYPPIPGTVDSLTIQLVDLQDISGKDFLYLTMRAADELNQYSPIGNTIKIQISPFICGDTDNDGTGPNVADLVYLVNYLFKGGTAPPIIESGDVTNDGIILVNDLVYLVNYIFKGGPPPICN
ncbi:MAG: putative Ig domain-containing protein [bacterium]